MSIPTFKPVVYSSQQRADGTYNLKIRITHRRESRKIATPIFVYPDELTRSCKIKNLDVLDKADRIVREWRNVIPNLGYAVQYMTVDDVVDYLKRYEKAKTEKSVFKLDFITYGREVASKKSEGTAVNYNIALNCLERFMKGHSLDVNDINLAFLNEFASYIMNEPTMVYSPKDKVLKPRGDKKGAGRAVSLYMSSIRHIYNQAKKEFNDEDSGVINIPRSPFARYEMPKNPRSKKRAISMELIQKIIDFQIPVDKRVGTGRFNQIELARDCFLLSFGLVGMNAADLYDCQTSKLINDNIFSYKRKKTRTRRDDEAEISIRVEKQIRSLFDKYLDESGQRLFCFHKHYSCSKNFNSCLSKGFSKLCALMEVEENFTFYSARHSWATIARSKDCKIDKYTVHEALNHIDPDMKVTDVYAAKDFSLIWEANKKVLNLFKW